MLTNARIVSLCLALSTIAVAMAPEATSFQRNARAAADQLMIRYDQSTGLWNDGKTPLWWNSANMLAAMIDLFSIDNQVRDKFGYIIATTYANAPATDPHATRRRSLEGFYTKDYIPRTDVEISERMSKREYPGRGFLNAFYDDEGWWALAWISAYDFTGNSEYLRTAKDIWVDMKGGETTPCGPGGIWWDRKKSYVASIANELFLATSAALAIRTRASERQQYLEAAITSLQFLKSHRLIGTDSLIVDGLDAKCNPTGAKFTYNQGVILGGLLDLTKATGDSSYLGLAIQIANAATASNSTLITNGILHEPNNCEKSNKCGNDGDQFKGIFVRNLRRLQQAVPNDRWKQFLATNAVSIWSNDRSGSAILGPNWAGPYVGDGKAPAQCSALECLIAAEAVC